MSTVSLLAVSASPSVSSKTHALAATAVELNGAGSVVDLAGLDAEALLGRRQDPAVDSLLASIGTASILVLVTPVYRATYSGLLKVVFDQLGQDALAGTASVLVASAAGPGHYLSLDTGLRALVASLGGWSVPTVTYAVPSDFGEDGRPLGHIVDRLAAGLGEAERVVGATAG
jgi:FMN reductase